jgi:hypothetical protein
MEISPPQCPSFPFIPLIPKQALRVSTACLQIHLWFTHGKYYSIILNKQAKDIYIKHDKVSAFEGCPARLKRIIFTRRIGTYCISWDVPINVLKIVSKIK